MKAVWKDLDKKQGLFTKRSTTMVALDTGAIIQHYGANTKINVDQETTVDGVRYFRTESAANNGLDWAFKASAFELPAELASLEPSGNTLIQKSSHIKTSFSANKNVSKTPNAPKSEEGLPEDRRTTLAQAFLRFFRRKK